jgi:hypothetical protein
VLLLAASAGMFNFACEEGGCPSWRAAVAKLAFPLSVAWVLAVVATLAYRLVQEYVRKCRRSSQ